MFVVNSVNFHNSKYLKVKLKMFNTACVHKKRLFGDKKRKIFTIYRKNTLLDVVKFKVSCNFAV